MDAAENVFFAKGYDSATMDEVAETAGLSKGLLYFYFKNKEDLCHAIVHRGLHVLQLSFEQVLHEHERGIEQVRAMGQAYIRFSTEHADHFNLMAAFQAAQSDTMDAGAYLAACDLEGGQVIELVAHAVQNGIDDGSIRTPVTPLEAAIVLWGQVQGLIQIIRSKKVEIVYRIDADQLLTAALDQVVNGYAR
jgi:AcrR family transcriptional regulator